MLNCEEINESWNQWGSYFQLVVATGLASLPYSCNLCNDHYILLLGVSSAFQPACLHGGGDSLVIKHTKKSIFLWHVAELPAEERERLEQEWREHMKLRMRKLRAIRKQNMEGECCQESNDESLYQWGSLFQLVVAIGLASLPCSCNLCMYFHSICCVPGQKAMISIQVRVLSNRVR